MDKIERFFRGVIIIILTTSSLLQWMVRSQLIFDPNTASNEVFGESIYDSKYPDFTMPPASAETNFSSFLESQSRHNFSDKTTRQGLDITSPQMFQSKTIAQLYTVFPGTVWCGVGNLAGNSEALGYFAQTDSCCRTHDKCRLTIPPGETKFSLTNTGYFTRSHCSCDEMFFFCLKRANSLVANKVGFTYFNLLRPQCFRKDFPIVACLRWFRKRCTTYIVDQNNGRDWQWFDNKAF